MSTFGSAPSCEPGDLVAELMSGRFPMFSTLVELVKYAGVVEFLSEADDITVLCPTNDAFVRAGITAPAGPGLPVMMDGYGACTREDVQILLQDHFFGSPRLGQLRQRAKAINMNGTAVMFSTDANLRTMVTKGSSTACVLMQGFTSSNASFAAIGRVLYEGNWRRAPPPLDAAK
jgi:hypothetical protein